MIVYVFSLSKLKTVLAQRVGGRLNGKTQTPVLDFHCLLAKIFFLKMIVICLLMKTPMIFHSQSHVEHTLSEKITAM